LNTLLRYDDILSQVPEYESFFTVDELESSTDRLLAAHPGVRAWQCGVSRAGHPLRCLEIGDGPLRAVLAGLPHPEEPFGTLVIEYLLQLLAETDLAERLGYTFAIVKAADPDGARVNEPWYGEPYDLTGYLDRVYRPATCDQLEWAFPFEYKGYAYARPLPEAEALKAVIDAGPVDLIMSLHNSSFSGAYFYITEDDDDLRATLLEAAAREGLPPHRGEPEVPYLVTLGDAVYKQFGLREEYDYLVENGQNPAAVLDSGTSSDDYAAALWDCFSIVAEVPAFTSDKAGDVAPAGVTRAEAKLRGIAAEQSHVDWLRERYPETAARLTRETPWLRTVNNYLIHAKTDLAAERRLVEKGAGFEREATVAELFDSVYLRELNTLHKVAQFASMLEDEDEPAELLLETAAAARARVRERAAQLQVAGALRPVPLQTAVRVQLAALLCALDHTRDRFRHDHPRPAEARAVTPGGAAGDAAATP
jgi:hypothetical protein